MSGCTWTEASCPFGTELGPRGALSSRSRAAVVSAALAQLRNSFWRVSHSTSTPATSLPGPGALWAGGRNRPGLRGHSPHGLLHSGPLELGLPGGRSGGAGGGGAGGRRCCWLLRPHLVNTRDHHRGGRASLSREELQGAGEG